MHAFGNQAQTVVGMPPQPPVRRQTTFVAPYIVEATVANRDRPVKQKTVQPKMKAQPPCHRPVPSPRPSTLDRSRGVNLF